jgi:hypothetical protein
MFTPTPRRLCEAGKADLAGPAYLAAAVAIKNFQHRDRPCCLSPDDDATVVPPLLLGISRVTARLAEASGQMLVA